MERDFFPYKHSKTNFYPFSLKKKNPVSVPFQFQWQEQFPCVPVLVGHNGIPVPSRPVFPLEVQNDPIPEENTEQVEPTIDIN